MQLKLISSLLVAALLVPGWPSQARSDEGDEIVRGVFGLLEQGINAANNANNNNNNGWNNNGWGGNRQPYSPGGNWNRNSGGNWNRNNWDDDYNDGYNNNNYNNNNYNNNTYTRPNLVNGHTPNQWYKHPTSQRYYYYDAYGRLYWDQSTAAATTTTTTAVAEEPAANYAPEVVAVEPLPNKIAAKCKAATAADLQRLAKRLESSQEEYVASIEDELKDYRINTASLISELAQAEAPVEVQTAALQAAKAGRGEDLLLLWTTTFKNPVKGEELSNKVALDKWCKDLIEDVEAGELSARKLREGRELFSKLEVPASARKELQAANDQLQASTTLIALIGDLKPLRGGMHELPGSFTVIRSPDVQETLVIGGGYVLANGTGEGVAIEEGATVADVMNWPLCAGQPCAKASHKWVGDGVLLLGPDSGSVTYTVDGKSATMNAGYQQPVSGSEQRVVSYDPGNGQLKKNTIGAGTYKFMPADGLWQLYKQSCKVEVNNRENPNDFHCVVDNQAVVVKAGEAKSWDSAYPVHVKYDRGDGQHPHEVRLPSGTYVVALNASEYLWDLYPQAEYASGE